MRFDTKDRYEDDDEEWTWSEDEEDDDWEEEWEDEYEDE
jgi:hypothetical protein